MRTTALACILFLASALSLSAGEYMRLNFVKGLYSANIPANWYVDVDTGDSTLSIAQSPDPSSPRVIIAIPNPTMANRLADYASLAANSFMNVLGGGQIVENKDNNQGHGVIFRSSAAGNNFVGAVQTQRHGNYAVLTIFLTRDSDYAGSKDMAALILDSLRVDDSALARQTAFVSAQADNLIRDLNRHQTVSVQTGSTPTTTLPNQAGVDSRSSPSGTDAGAGSLWGSILGGALGGAAGGRSGQVGSGGGILGSILGSILGEDGGAAGRQGRTDGQTNRQDRGDVSQTAPWGKNYGGNQRGYGDLLNNPFSGLTQ